MVRHPSADLQPAMNTLPPSHRLPTIIAAAALAVLLSGPAASAQTGDTASGNFMLPYCEQSLLIGTGQASRDKTPYLMGVCFGIIEALLYAGSIHPPQLGICKETGVTRQQGVRVVIKYLKDHPEQLHRNFIQVAHVALRQAWPCDKDWAVDKEPAR
jgi:hypothetical protein